jgi:hypothetical protein
MSASVIAAALGALGLAGNLGWMLINLRMENRIGVKIDGLKAWMEDRYVSVAAWEGCRRLCGERHAEVCRRLEELEGRR